MDGFAALLAISSGVALLRLLLLLQLLLRRGGGALLLGACPGWFGLAVGVGIPRARLGIARWLAVGIASFLCAGGAVAEHSGYEVILGPVRRLSQRRSPVGCDGLHIF